MREKPDYFCSDSIREDLKGKTVRGGGYTGAAQVGCTLIQLATLPILARLLTKDDFGLVAMALVFTGFAQIFVDAGMSMATVQREKITHAQVSNLFWLSSALGVLMAVIAAALAPAIAWFYDDARLTPIVLALALPFVFSGMTSQHRALLVRSLRFRELASIQVLSNLFARLLAVYLAWQYRSFWALAIGQAAVPLFAMLLNWFYAGWWPGLPSKKSGVGEMVSFGAHLTGFSMLNFFGRNADNLLIGKFWGEGELGVYDQSYKLFMMPLRKLNGPLQAVALPALSRVAVDKEKFTRYYLGMLRKLALVTVPVAFFMLARADAVVATMLGEGWEDTVPVIRVLAFAGVFQAAANTFSWVYLAQGKSREMLQTTLFTSPVVVISFVCGLYWGALGVACSYALCVACLVFPFQVYRVCQIGPIKWSDILRPIATAAAVGLFVCGVVLLARLATVHWNPFADLAVSLAVALAALVAALLLIPTCRFELVQAKDLVLTVARRR